MRIGFSPFIGVSNCRIGDAVRIGHFNLFYGIADLDVGEKARVGFFNVFRGGERLQIGPYATVLRQNVFNAIIEQDFVSPVDSTLRLGAGSVVTAGHWLEFSAGIEVGDYAILGGRNSSFWTHQSPTWSSNQNRVPLLLGIGGPSCPRSRDSPFLHRGLGFCPLRPIRLAAFVDPRQSRHGRQSTSAQRPDSHHPQRATTYQTKSPPLVTRRHSPPDRQRRRPFGRKRGETRVAPRNLCHFFLKVLKHFNTKIDIEYRGLIKWAEEADSIPGSTVSDISITDEPARKSNDHRTLRPARPLRSTPHPHLPHSEDSISLMKRVETSSRKCPAIDHY